MLLINRDTLVSDITWTALEKMTESGLKISTEQQAQRVTTAEIDGLRRALEEEQVRKTAEERAAGKSSEAGEDALSSHDNPQPVTSPTTAAPPPGPPPPGAPPPPPPMFGGMKKTVAAIRSIFDKARFYQPKKRMKKLNWEKAPEYDAKLLSALWHKASEVDVGVRVSVSEKLIETLFCQKAENTDGQFAGKSTKTHLPDQKKALNVNIVLGSMKTERPDPDNPASMKKVPLSNEEVLSVIREGNTAAITLNQVTILKEQAPNDKDVGFLNQFNSDRSGLGRVERFMLGLLDMSAYSVRLRVLRTRKVFEELEGDYLPTFELIHTAMKELMSSSSLRDLFYIILLTGNFINGNTKLGSAYGFKISSLQRLSTTLANVKKKTTHTVNFLHYLVTVCEKDCPRLLKFRSELPHLDDASRVSVVIIQEELNEWQEEIDKLKEVMSAANDEGLPPDFIGQMQEFIPEAEAILGRLGGGLEAVCASGRKLAQYLCDSRDDFLEVVFGEIKNFSDEFDLTVKETVQEKPIWLTPDPTPPADGTPAALLSPQPNSIPPSPTDSQPRRGIRRATATSIITEHVMDIPSSLMPITEEEQLSQNVERDDNPFVFPQGQIRGDGYTSTSHESSPPIYMTPTTDPEIVITNLEGEESNEVGSNDIHREITTSETPALGSTTDAVEWKHISVRRNSSLSGPRSRTKRHSIHEVNRPGFSMLSRQASWNDYKGHSPPLQRRGWTGNVQRYQSVDPHTIFGGSLDDVVRLLHKMAEAIQKDSGN